MLARRRSRSRGSLRRYIVWAVLLLTAGGAVYFIFFSSALLIQEVEVDGGELAPGVDFNEAVGKNIVLYRPSFSLADVHQADSIKLDKQYLRRTLKFTLSAKERYAIWCMELRAECFWIDKDGTAVALAPDIKGPLVVRLIRDKSERELVIGERVLKEDMFQNLKMAFMMLEQLDIPVQDFKIENLKFREAVVTTNGPSIYFSLQDDPSFGRTVIEQLRGGGEWNAVNYLDLRVPGRAYYSQ